MTDRPETYYQLPEDFAAALGQAIAGFGWLEEVMKRVIYSLDRARLAGDLNPEEMGRWQRHMDEIADDSMGTLIEQIDAAMRRHPGIPRRNQINDRLTRLKLYRNLFCHASWRPMAEKGRWHPSFVNTHGRPFPEDFVLDDIRTIVEDTREVGAELVAIMRGTGIMGEWVGDS